MSFFFTGFWGLSYLVALTILGLVTIYGSNTKVRRVLYIMIANWIGMRSIVTFFNYDPAMILALDIAAFVAFIIYGRSMTAYVCSVIFFAIIQFDFLQHAGLLNFPDVAAVQDLLGFILLLIMAGAANDFWSGRRLRLPNLWRNRNSAGNSMATVRNNTPFND